MKKTLLLLLLSTPFALFPIPDKTAIENKKDQAEDPEVQKVLDPLLQQIAKHFSNYSLTYEQINSFQQVRGFSNSVKQRALIKFLNTGFGDRVLSYMKNLAVSLEEGKSLAPLEIIQGGALLELIQIALGIIPFSYHYDDSNQLPLEHKEAFVALQENKALKIAVGLR